MQSIWRSKTNQSLRVASGVSNLYELNEKGSNHTKQIQMAIGSIVKPALQVIKNIPPQYNVTATWTNTTAEHDKWKKKKSSLWATNREWLQEKKAPAASYQTKHMNTATKWVSHSHCKQVYSQKTISGE